MAKDRMEFDGTVEEFSNGKFSVRVSDTHIVTATLSGKIRQAAIKIIAGDKVRVEVSPYCVEMGRIIYRLKQ